MITVLPPSYAGPLQAVHCGLGGLLELERKQWARRWQRQCIFFYHNGAKFFFQFETSATPKILSDSIKKILILKESNNQI